MLCIDSLLEYSKKKFQALQLITFAVFGAVFGASCILAHCVEI